MKETRKIYFEVMRILACGLVIFNHLEGYSLYMNSQGMKQFFYMCLSMFTRINVPLFFMISGALLLRKEESITAILKKRISRIIFVLLLFDGIILTVYKFNAIKMGEDYEYSIIRYVFGFLTNQFDGTEAYWYMYAYLGFLFMLPFMQRVAKELSKSEVVILLCIHFVAKSFIPMLNILFSIMGLDPIHLCSDFQVPFALAKAFFYPLIGYYLEYNIDVNQLKGKHITGLIITGCMGILLSNLCTYYEGITTGKYTQNYVQLFDYLIAIVMFLIIKFMVAKITKSGYNRKIEKIICFIGSLTLGIYLFDPILRVILYQKYKMLVEPVFPILIISFGWIVISMLCGGGITYIMKKIPGIKKIM